MNKSQLQKIREIISYDPNIPEHKRLLRRLKKRYSQLPKGQRVDLIKDLKKMFNSE
tara:strand:+ start:167 stop:334 length:168 start_codon:yes stop_codon:yes gene_type:complete